jgi:hypothetical protein
LEPPTTTPPPSSRGEGVDHGEAPPSSACPPLDGFDDEAAFKSGMAKFVSLGKKLDRARFENQPIPKIVQICKDLILTSDRLWDLVNESGGYPPILALADQFGLQTARSSYNTRAIEAERLLERHDSLWVEAHDRERYPEADEEGPPDAPGTTHTGRVEVETNPPGKSHLGHLDAKQGVVPQTPAGETKPDWLLPERRVRHHTYGVGTVIPPDHDAEPDSAKVEIKFDRDSSTHCFLWAKAGLYSVE